jgi:TP901 family phage tail tape measure protein
MNESVAIEMAIRARRDLSAMDDTIRKVREMKRRFANMARSVIGYAQKISAAVAKMKAAFIKLNNAFRTLRNVALKAFTALVALTGIPIYKFAKFEQAMANVNTLLDTSSKKFRELQDGVIAVSNRVGESAESLSTALYDIVSAGVQAGNSISVLDLSARAATAGMTNAQTAVNAGIATVNAFNLEIQDLTNVFDLQFQTVRKGVITYEQLSHAQGELLPSARKLNESLENMYGSLAFVTKNGLSAEMASTSLARAYDGLIQKSNELADAGVKVYDEFGKFRGIVDIVEDLSERLKGLSDQQMQSILQDIGFEIRAARAIIPMIKNIEGLRESIGAMEDSAGSMEAAFEKATSTIQFRFNKAKERVTNAIIAIGRTFKTEINSMLDDVGSWALAIQDFVSENREAIKLILTFALRLTAAVAVVAAIGTALMSLLTPIGLVSTAMFAFGAAWYLNMWNIRDKTETAIDKIVGFWGILKETTQSTVNSSIKEWNKFKEWWQNTTWIEKAQDIGEITLAVAGWGFDEGKKITQSLKEWIEEKYGVELTVDNAIDAVIGIGEFTFHGMKNLASDFSNWFKQKVMPSDGSIEEQIEREMGNSGIGELLKAVYRAEGGKDASALYGTTQFKENGHKFAKQANQEFFEGLVSSMGIEKDSQGWYAASSATTINHYWDNFKDNYELAADQTLASLSDEMQDKFIKYLGSNYSPTKGNLTPAEEKLNKNWIPNVREFYEENKQFSESTGIVEQIGGSLTLDAAIDFTIGIGSITLAFTAAKLISAIIAELVAQGILLKMGAQMAIGGAAKTAGSAGLALAGGLTIGATLSVLLDPEINNYNEWKEQFKEGLKTLFSQSFWEDLWLLAKTEWKDIWNSIENWTQEKIETFLSKEFWVGVWNEMQTSFEESLDGMVTSFKELFINPVTNLFNGEGENKIIWTDWFRTPEPSELSPSALPKQIIEMFTGYQYAAGGYISGPGTSTSDSIPAMLSNGEYVINASQTKKFLPLLQAINSGNISQFADGGSVGGINASGANQIILNSSGLGDNQVLKYLAKVSKDTENFKYIIDLISGFKKMKSEYQEKLTELNNLTEELRKQIEKQLDEINGNTSEFNANLSDLTNELSSFANNIANITGSNTAGLVGSLIGSGKSLYDQFQNFGNATDLMGKLTSGFGIANAGLSIIGAIQSYNQKENEEILAEYKKQLEVDQEQLKTLRSIQNNTEDTAKNIIKAVAQNPTSQNVTLAREQVVNQADFMLENRPNFGTVDITGYDQDRWWHGKEREHHSYSLYDTARKLGKDVSMFSGYGKNIMDLPFEELKQFEKQFSSITINQVKKLKGGIDKEFSTDLRTIQAQLETYVKTVSALNKVQNNIAESSRLESFEGIDYISQAEALEQYKEQLKETYKAAGYTDSEIRKMDSTITDIAENLAKTTNNIVTIMQEVRSSFISTFSEGNSLIYSFTQGLSSYFATLKNNISSMVYNLNLSGLDTYFEDFFESINTKLANYSGNNPLEYAENLISSSDIDSGFNKIIDLYQNSNNLDSINEMLSEQFRQQAEEAGLGDNEIADLLEQLGIATEKAAEELQKFAGEVKNAPSGFKQERFTYEAVDSRRVSEKTTISGNTFIIQGQNAEELIEEIRKLDKNAKLQKTGTPAGTLEGG